ncbi:MAG: hypothetical protein JST06_10610 [Bacteroidetes bacterium]|nr:hypothetical protein [Bacteroidota bacterium]MBS1629792.1 hypothetical protein [Bacteroidota bacterium]
MRSTLFVFACLIGSLISNPAWAQDDLFGTKAPAPKKGFVIGVNGNIDEPAADMAQRFGLSFRLGPSLFYKTKNNWMFGAKGDFVFGNKIKEDSLLVNVSDQYGAFINSDGERIGVQLYERGYAVGLQAGKMFPLSKSKPDAGLLLLTGAGFIQHKISIFDKDKTIPQIRGDYRKGYDRLTNGWYLEQYIGYQSFDRHGLLNFHIGFDLLAGFTQGRRDYQFDIMRPDNSSRLDLLIGIRGGWYIPIFKSSSEGYMFQ